MTYRYFIKTKRPWRRHDPRFESKVYGEDGGLLYVWKRYGAFSWSVKDRITDRLGADVLHYRSTRNWNRAGELQVWLEERGEKVWEFVRFYESITNEPMILVYMQEGRIALNPDSIWSKSVEITDGKTVYGSIGRKDANSDEWVAQLPSIHNDYHFLSMAAFCHGTLRR